EIIAPRIREVTGSGFIGHQRHAVDAAAIGGRIAAASHADAAGLVAVAPVHERLRIGKSRCFRNRKAYLGIDCIVGAPGPSLHAAAWDEIARRVVGEVGREWLWPLDRVRGNCGGLALRYASCDLQASEKTRRDLVGGAARNLTKTVAALGTF